MEALSTRDPERWSVRVAPARAVSGSVDRVGPLGTGEIDVWLLSPSRHDRQGRGVRRAILAAYAGVAPDAIQFAAASTGKPRLAWPEDTALSFNVAHSDGGVAVAVSRAGPVGVDIERHRPRSRLGALADAILAPSERDWWRRQQADTRDGAFYDLWSAKEAVAKLTGRGLSLPFRDIALAAPGAACTRVACDFPAQLHVTRLPCWPGFAGWVAWCSQPGNTA